MVLLNIIRYSSEIPLFGLLKLTTQNVYLRVILTFVSFNQVCAVVETLIVKMDIAHNLAPDATDLRIVLLIIWMNWNVVCVCVGIDTSKQILLFQSN